MFVLSVAKILILHVGLCYLWYAFAEKKEAFAGTDSYDALVFASAGYCQPWRVSNWTMKNEGCKKSTSSFLVEKVYNGPENAFAFVGLDVSKKWIVAAFKGTNSSVEDFIEDLEGGEFMTQSCEANGTQFPGKSHSGFCEFYKKIAKNGLAADILSLKNQYPAYDVVFTGHSLGATAAIYAAYDTTIRSNNTLRCKVFGFGQPRIGNHEFASSVASTIGENIFRVVHRSDIVAHLPICCSVFGSACGTSDKCPYHLSGEYWYNNEMIDVDNFRACDGGEDPSCSNMFDLSVDDHTHYYGVEVGDYCCF